MKPRILIIENSGAITGGLKSIIRSSQALSDKFDFYFILPNGSQAAPYVREHGFQLISLPMKEISRRPVSWLIYFPYLVFNTARLFTILKRYKIHLLVSNDFYNMLPVVYKFLGGRIGYGCYVRFLPDRFPQFLVTVWMTLHEKYAEKIIAVSKVTLSKLPKSIKTIIVPNELPVEFSDVTDFQYDQDSRQLLYLGNYIEGKGQEFALEAFSRIHTPKWRLRFVGGDMGLKKNQEYLQRLKNRSAELDLDDQVEWAGFATDIRKEYFDASIVLNFSNSESFSLVCLEAMYFGRPVIATRSGGPEEMIEDGISGLLVQVGDVESMVKAMTSLVDNAPLREELGREAFSSIRKKFAHSLTIDKLGDLYEEILNKA